MVFASALPPGSSAAPMGFAVDDGSDAVSCSPAHPAKGNHREAKQRGKRECCYPIKFRCGVHRPSIFCENSTGGVCRMDSSIHAVIGE